MNDLQVFSNLEFGTIRTEVKDGEAWFVGKDVTDILGYKNTSSAIQRHVDTEDKGVTKVTTLGGEQSMTVINESGLYSLVFSSKLPAAKKFKRWIQKEVLHDIGRHGAYATDTTIDKIIADPEFGIRLLTELNEERKKRQAVESTLAARENQILEMKPKVSYYDVVLNCEDLIGITKIAKDYGWSGQQMNEYLHKKGVQYKTADGQWLLYQKYAAAGYVATKTHMYSAHGVEHSRIHTYWTQKGRLFIYDLLKSDGILPTIEEG